MKNILFALLLFPYSLIAQLPIKAYGMTKIEKTWEKYSTENYSINRVASWEIMDAKQFGSEFIFFISDIIDDPNFRENINLLIQNLDGKNIDLDQYVSISEDQIKSMITNVKIIESTRIKGDFYESHRILFTGDQGIYKLKFEQRYILNNNKAYVLTYTAQEADFDYFLNDADKAMDSFNYLN